jgi:hypothetical protein
MAEYGFRRAFTEVIMGLVLSQIVSTFVSSGLIQQQYKLLFDLINILAIISLVQVMPYWGTAYLFGWWISIGIMVQSGILEAWEFLIYFITGIVILTKRFLKKLD